MCKCTPEIKTPYCGKFGCEWPEIKFNCGECGSRNFKLMSVKGRFFPWKKYSKIRLEKDVFLHVCQDCDNCILAPGDCEKLDIGLEESIRGGSSES